MCEMGKIATWPIFSSIYLSIGKQRTRILRSLVQTAGFRKTCGRYAFCSELIRSLSEKIQLIMFPIDSFVAFPLSHATSACFSDSSDMFPPEESWLKTRPSDYCSFSTKI